MWTAALFDEISIRQKLEGKGKGKGSPITAASEAVPFALVPRASTPELGTGDECRTVTEL